jgi:hypothetical protein
MFKTEEILALEERWKELQDKRLFRKLVIFFLTLLVILSIVLVYLIITKGRQIAPVAPVANVTVVAPVVNATTPPAPVAPPKEEPKPEPKKTQELPPNININIKVDTPSGAISAQAKTSDEVGDDEDEVKSAPEPKKSAPAKPKPKPKIEIKQETPPPPPAPPKNQILIESAPMSGIDDLINKFETTNNIAFANMIADEYFEQGNFTKSLEWALRANEVDKEDEASWVMFAKSQMGLGNKEDAIRALENYTAGHKNAISATALLQKIKTGEYQ